MKTIFSNNKFEAGFIFVVLLFAFYLRWQGAVNAPIAPDEPIKHEFAKRISLDPQQLTLPLGDTKTHNGPLLPYLIRASMAVGGESTLAGRIPSLIYSALTLLFLYFLVKESLDQETAVLCFLCLAVSQLHIGFTRIVDENGFLMFFVVMTLFFVQKALREGRRYCVVGAGLMLGLGGLVKGTMFTILPGLLIYLWIDKDSRYPFSKKDIILLLFTAGIAVFPSVYWDMTHDYTDFNYHLNKTRFFFFSFIPFALFLGELIVFRLHTIDDTALTRIISFEYPFCNWLMGLICLIGATYYLNKRRNGFIHLLLWIFWSIFIFFALVQSKSGGGAFFHLDNFWWAIVAVIPGFILGTAWLVELSRQYRPVKYILIPVILLYFTMNSWNLVHFPALCSVPRDSVKRSELRRTALSYRDQGLPERALKVQEYIRRHYGQEPELPGADMDPEQNGRGQ